MITAANLKTCTHKDLARMAKERGISGWHSMRKEQLVKALLRDLKQGARGTKSVADRKTGGKNGTESAPRAKPGKRQRPTAAQLRVRRALRQKEQFKDLSSATSSPPTSSAANRRDRAVLMVRDPYWLQVNWEVSSRTIQRARVALAENWHTATPILRLLRIPTTILGDCSEEVEREVEIHGAVNCWYLDVQDPPGSFRVELGYQTDGGQFFSLARSNTVSTPNPGSTEAMESASEDVIENSERIFAMSGGYNGTASAGELREWLEERLQRPLGSPTTSRFGNGAEGVLRRRHQLEFSIDCEIVVHGATDASAFVTMGGEPVKLKSDGSFTARLSLPDRRQVIPIVASTRDGAEEQTIVLAVERNTKVLEPKMLEPGE